MTTNNNCFTKKDTYITKGCAILLLLFHHLFYDDLLVNNESYIIYLFPRITKLLCKYGYICIFIFATLTGYGLYKKKEMSLRELIIKNETKLLSTFVLNYLLCSIIYIVVNNNGLLSYINIYGDYNAICKIAQIAIDMLGFSEIFHTKTINASWWYMSGAHLIIIILPILIKINEKLKTQNIFFVLLLIYCGSHFHDSSPLCCCILAAYIGYLLGESNYFYRISNSFQSKTICILLNFLMPVMCVFLMEKLSGYFLFACFGGVSFMTITYLLLNKQGIISFVLEKLGKVSNVMYMSHVFIISLVITISRAIYSLKYAILIYAISCIIIYFFSLFSVYINKKIQFDKIINRVINKIL